MRLVDAQKNLLEAQQLVDRFELSRLGVVIFDSEAGRRVIDAADLAEYDYSGMQMGQAPEMSGFKGEAAFTGALLDLMESRKPKILFTVGHGELQLDDFSPRGLSSLRDLLGKDNFEMEEWRLLGQTMVPDGHRPDRRRRPHLDLRRPGAGAAARATSRPAAGCW